MLNKLKKWCKKNQFSFIAILFVICFFSVLIIPVLGFLYIVDYLFNKWVEKQEKKKRKEE